MADKTVKWTAGRLAQRKVEPMAATMVATLDMRWAVLMAASWVVAKAVPWGSPTAVSMVDRTAAKKVSRMAGSTVAQLAGLWDKRTAVLMAVQKANCWVEMLEDRSAEKTAARRAGHSAVW